MRRARADGGRFGVADPAAGPGRRQFLGAALLGPLAVACAPQRSNRLHEVGMSTRPILPETLALPPVLPPPTPGSTGERAELDDLIARRHRRGDAAITAARTEWQGGVATRWNGVARDLVARNRIDLLAASRLYALLGVAQHDACFHAQREQKRLRRPPPAGRVPGLQAEGPLEFRFAYPSLELAVAAASRSVLVRFFPDERGVFAQRMEQLRDLRATAGMAAASDLEAGQRLGDAVGANAVAFAESDGAAEALTALPAPEAVGTPTPGVWNASPGREPLGRAWGRVRPWVMKDVRQVRAPAPPPLESPQFTRALGEVRRLSDSRTREQTRLAALWADGVGSYTPAGRWNKIASDLVRQAALTEAQAVRTFALLNVALMDAGIACWDSKFHYGLWRPYQADEFITTPVGKPEFPSYTSAHASFSGAAAGVLGQLFPGQQAPMEAKAREAAVSRMYGGMHYAFDADAGLAQGRAVAALTMTWGRARS